MKNRWPVCTVTGSLASQSGKDAMSIPLSMLGERDKFGSSGGGGGRPGTVTSVPSMNYKS